MITGHLVHLAVRALGALRTASPPLPTFRRFPLDVGHPIPTNVVPLNPKWVFFAFVAAVVILVAERAVHHDLSPLVVGVVSNRDVWGRFQAWHVAQRHRPATIRHYDVVLHDLWGFLKDHKITSPEGSKVPRQWWQVTPKLFDRWLERPCNPGKRNAGQPLARNSCHVYSTRALFFYDWASRKRLLPGRNPLDDVLPVRRGTHRPRALPLPEVTDLLHALADTQRLYLMACLCYYQALRVGEVCRLSVEDLDWTTSPPSIRVQGKGGVERWMDLNATLVPILRAYLITRPSSGPLLPSHTHPNQHLSPAYASHLLAEVMRPLVGDSAHALRHTNASELRAAGVDLLGLMSVLRHTSASSTQVYLDDRPGLVAGYLSLLPDPLAGESLAPT